jgi:hypothetical protein
VVLDIHRLEHEARNTSSRGTGWNQGILTLFRGVEGREEAILRLCGGQFALLNAVDRKE